eukprot:Em0010g50a
MSLLVFSTWADVVPHRDTVHDARYALLNVRADELAVNWLNSDKSLREQGISETAVLTLRKRFFFSDQNVDRNDPVQLNLIYCREEAVQFAALQCQIQYGNHNEAKHKPGFLNLDEFLPEEYVKFKGIEKLIWTDHRKLHNLTELNAKFRYIQCVAPCAHSDLLLGEGEAERTQQAGPPTPGNHPGKHHEGGRDNEGGTQDLASDHCASDFGDYSESFYSVQTTEGETISQLIAGYIDIIMQKKQPVQNDMADDDTAVVVDDEVLPNTHFVDFGINCFVKLSCSIPIHWKQSRHRGVGHTANMVMPQQAMTDEGAMFHASGSAQFAEEIGAPGKKPATKTAKPHSCLQPSKACLPTLDQLSSHRSHQQDLLSQAQLPQLGSDSASIKWKQTTLDVSRQNVSSAVAAMLASTASIITLTQGDPMDTNYTAVGSAVTTISTNLTEMAKANRQQLLMTSGDMAMSGSQLLGLVGEQEVDQGTQDALVAMAKAVATATAALVTNAKNVAAKCDDQALQNQVIVAAKQTALATQGLIACTKVLAPCINSPLCQEQLIEACKLVAAAVEKIVLAAQAACKDGDALRDLGAAATAVTTALNDLIQQIKEGVRMEAGQYDEACEAILAATDRLFSSMGNAQEMVKQAKLLAEATSALVNAIKLESENENDPDARRRLLDAARALADATSKMVEAAKGAARNPGDEQAQEALRKAAEYLRAVTNAAASNALKKKAIRKLEIAAKQTAAVSTQLIAAAQGLISQLIQSVRASVANPDSPSAQLGLINASMNMIPPAGKMVAAAKAAVPTVGDQAAALQLGNFAKATASALADLRTATSKASEMCGSLEIDSAIDTVRSLSQEMGEAKMEAQTGQLLPLPGETVESCALELAATSKTVGSSMAQLLTAASQGNENYTGMAARDTASALRILGNAVRGVAAGTKNRQTQGVHPERQPNSNKACSSCQGRLQALNQVVNCLPGQIEFDQAIKAIAQASLTLQAEKTLQSNLSSAAAALNATGSEVVGSSQGYSRTAAIATVKFAHCYEELLKAGLTLAGASKDKESQNEMLGYLRNISQKECDNALRNIEAGRRFWTSQRASQRAILFDCLDMVIEKSKRQAAQAAYLVGISDPSSTAAIPGLVDQNQFARRSSKTSNPVAKKHFVQAAKEVANSTANLVKNIKALAADLSEENSKHCLYHTTTPGAPGSVSKHVFAQLPIVQSGKNVIKSSSSLLTSAKSLAINPQDPPMWQLLAAHTKAVTDSIKALILAIRDKCPGQKECDSAIDGLNATINQLDQAILSAMNQQLHPNASSSLQGFQEQLLQAVGDIGEHVKPIATAAKGEAEKLGHQVTAMCNVFPSLAGAAIGAASKTTSSQLQISLLEQTKTVTESALQLVYAAKEAGGNTKSTAVHGKVDEAAILVQTAVGPSHGVGGALGVVGPSHVLWVGPYEWAGPTSKVEFYLGAMVDEIKKAMARVQESPGEVSKTFADYQTDTFTYCKAITKNAQEMVVKASSVSQELPTFSRELTNAYSQLVDTTQCALATIDSQNVNLAFVFENHVLICTPIIAHQIASRLSQNVRALGEACIELVFAGGTLQTSPDDQAARRELTDNAKSVTEKACNSAIATIMGLVGDLDTTTMFCTAGALHSEDKLGTFAEHRVNILETAKVLVDDTKKLVSSAAGTQEQLAEAAIQAVKTITAEAEHVKLGAASLATEDMEAQLLLLQAAKDVANALSDLIGATRSAAGKSVQDAAMEQLKSSAKVMVAKVSNLLKTVKNVEDEAAKGVRSLENAIEAIASDLQEFESSNPPKSQATAEDLIRSTKGITLASAKAVSAGNSCRQLDISACANLARKAVTELLETCKSAAYKAENGELKAKTLMTGRECATSFKALLELVHQIVLKPTYEKKQSLPTFSKEVATWVGDVVQVAEQLKGSDWVDLRDPNVIAENELLQAAASIEAAAKKLSELQPRREVRADESLTFEEQILEAAKNIASATSALVKSASAAQRELVAQGKLSSKPQSEDSQWSEGLVSAAKLVAAATSNLCEAANMMVQGHAQEDKLIAAAKSVAASTAQLLIACQVKADARSENNRRLQMAGQAVKKATETLVAAAQQAAVEGGRADGASGGAASIQVNLGGKVMNRFRQELEIAEQIAAKERELEQARLQLTKIRKGQN